MEKGIWESSDIQIYIRSMLGLWLFFGGCTKSYGVWYDDGWSDFCRQAQSPTSETDMEEWN